MFGRIWKRIAAIWLVGWQGQGATLLFFGAFAFLVSSFLVNDIAHATWWLNVSYTIATILIAWLAVFGQTIVNDLTKPILDINFSYDSAVHYVPASGDTPGTWHLSLLIENTGGTPARNAIVKCVRIVPTPLQTIHSDCAQPISPIPMQWVYWDAYQRMYESDQGISRSLHRTIYQRDACGIISITKAKGEQEQPRASFNLTIFPNRGVWYLEPGKEYELSCRIEAENYDSGKTWTFKIRWSGEFPSGSADLAKCIHIKQV